MKFLVAFVAAIAMANAAVLVKDPSLVVSTPLERTSIVGPSGTITQDKNLPVVGAAIAAETLVKVAEPTAVITNPVVPVVPEVKTVEPVAVPFAKVETIGTPVVSPVVTSPLVTPVGVPLYKTGAPLTYSYMPYDPFYFYEPKYIY